MRKVRIGFLRLLTETTGRKKVVSGYGRMKVDRQIWTIVVVAFPFSKVCGYYCPMLKQLVIDGTEAERDRLDTLLHEIGHGLDPGRSERVILKQGHVQADLLTAFGYKLI